MRLDSEESVLHFEKINKISKIHENFAETQKFIDNFKTLSAQLDEIQQLIENDGVFNLGSSMPNLLKIHYKISILRDLEDNARFYALQSTEDVRRTITKHFSPLDNLVEQFDSILFDISQNLLEVLKTGDKSLVVRVAKIIDVEEKQDLAAQIVEEIQEDSLDRKKSASTKKLGFLNGTNGGVDDTKNFRRSIGHKPLGFNPNEESKESNEKQNLKMFIGSLKKLHRIRRGYPERFFEAIQKSIASLFSECRLSFNNDPDVILDNLGWIFSDLEAVKYELVKCMPARWKVFNKFVNFYHVELYKMLDEILAKEPSALILLKILQYVKVYYKHMDKVLGIVRDDDEGELLLVPPLLDGREEKLYDDYLHLIVSKLHEWRENMAVSEKTNFIERQVPPDVNDDKRLGLQGEVIMFSIISQQVDVAAESGQGRILLGTIEECGAILRERQRSWEKAMREQVQLQLNEPANVEQLKEKDPDYVPIPGGLVEYLMALANDQIRGADYAEALSTKTTAMVSIKYKNQIIAVWDSVCDGFISVAKACIAGLISIVFNDIKTPFENIFVDSTWYKGKPTRQITDTIQEYIDDCQAHLLGVIYEVFLDDLLEETINRYLGSLLNKGVSLKGPKAIDRINTDIEELYKLFNKNHEDDKHVQSHFRVFEHFISALDAEHEELPNVFIQLRSHFWDAPLELFEAMVYARKDIDNKKAKEIILTARNLALHHSQDEERQRIERAQNQDQQVSQKPAQQPTYISQFGKAKN